MRFVLTGLSQFCPGPAERDGDAETLVEAFVQSPDLPGPASEGDGGGKVAFPAEPFNGYGDLVDDALDGGGERVLDRRLSLSFTESLLLAIAGEGEGGFFDGVADT